MRKSIFEVTPDELLDDEKVAQLKKEMSLKIKIRRQLREKTHQKELFDPSKHEHFLAQGFPPEEADTLAFQRFKERTDDAYEPPEMR